MTKEADAELFLENTADYLRRNSNGRIQARYISPFAVILYAPIPPPGEVYPIIGSGTWIGHYCIIDGSGGLDIGENCDISCGAHIYSHTTHRRCTLDESKQFGCVLIGNHVFLGPNSVINRGCVMEDRSMLGPVSFLKPYTHVKSYELYLGVPAKREGDLRKKK